MQEVKKIKSTGSRQSGSRQTGSGKTKRLRDDRLASNNSTGRTTDGGDELISSALSKPEINWLQNRENRTKIEGAPGNLWISNKPLWVSEMSKKNRGGKTIGTQGTSRSVHKEKKYVVVSMRGDQIQNIQGTYRDNTQRVSGISSRRSFRGDRPKPSRPKEEF
ncbi:MAG: hypothetical protein AAF944_02675 [Bacteroidota bacterium]